MIKSVHVDLIPLSYLVRASKHVLAEIFVCLYLTPISRFASHKWGIALLSISNIGHCFIF